MTDKQVHPIRLVKYKWPVDKAWQVSIWLRLTSHLMNEIRTKELGKYNLSVMNSAIIIILHNSEQMVRPIDIARQMHRGRRFVTETLNRMQQNGLITRKKHPKKKNQIILSLTQKGEELYREIAKQKSIHKIMANFSNTEIDNSLKFLKKLYTAISQTDRETAKEI